VEERERSQRNDQQLSDYEAEIGLLRRRLETLETDREKDKKNIAHLQDAVNRTRVVCMSHVCPQNLHSFRLTLTCLLVGTRYSVVDKR